MGEEIGLKLIDQIEDSLEDEIGLCLRRLHATQTWTTVKGEIFDQLMCLMKGERYMRFTGNYRDTTLRDLYADPSPADYMINTLCQLRGIGADQSDGGAVN